MNSFQIKAKVDRPLDGTTSAAARVEFDLREAIIRLDLKPGTRLSEQEIADRLDVSRQPVREALISLARSKLIEIKSKRGSYVAKISAHEMMEARFVREAIETSIALRACQVFDPWTRSSIDSILERQEEAQKGGDNHQFRHADEQFHQALASGTGCPMAWRVITDIKAHIDRVCNLQLRKPSSSEQLILEHRAIMAAIDARDGNAAVEAMRTHLHGIISDLPRIEAENPDLFE